MRAWNWMALLALLGGAGAAQEISPFPGEEDALAAQSAADDQTGPGDLSLRWRMQGGPESLRQARVYQRVEWRPGPGREVYLLLEKDPGERRLGDFAAFYGRWQSAARPVELVVGDLRPGCGQGLVFGRSGSGHTLALPQGRRDSRLLGYRSSDENQAVRGVALRLGGEALGAVVLAGQARRDARLDREGQVVSLPQSGLHVTARERQGHGLLAARVLGGRVRGRIGRAEIGVSAQCLRFDHRLDLRHSGWVEPVFQGRVQQVAGADLRFDLEAVQGFAEAARGRGGSRALLAGVRTGAGRVRLGGMLRYYGPGFHSFFGGAPSAADMQNERGCLLAAEGRQGKGRWQLFLDRRQQVQPATPAEQVWGLRASSPLPGALQGELCWQQETRLGRSGSSSWTEPGRRLRVELERRVGQTGRLGLKAEGRVLKAKGGEEAGALGGLFWQGQWRRGRFTLHLTRFHTSAYAARLYEYEYELPGTASVRSLSGDGWRGYGLLEWSWRKLALSGRYRWQQVEGRSPQHQFGVQVDY